MNQTTRLLGFLILCVFYASSAFAQMPERVSIKGIVTDTSRETLPFATVLLLHPKDSSLVQFKQSDDKGAFEFTKIKNAPYILKVFYTGYIPSFQPISLSENAEINVGTLRLKIIAKELMEVVVKTAKSTLTMRGDTMEYNAAAFKVPPGSTVEDLLRRLPGIEVDADGNLKAQGKDVKKLYVDGKTFFGSDPKAATKNLDANVISKVQVFNEKSEQSKLTGVDDGKKEKAMNLELKEEFKKGSFGKITAAAGTEERWASRGNYNKFNKKEQFSIIGFGNNINETGVNWEDYSEFKGQNTWGNQDQADFGFRGGTSGRFYSMGNNAYMNNFDGRGFTKNAGIGTNYNFDNKKRKFNANYFYNQTALDLKEFGEKQSFLRASSFYNTDTLKHEEFRQNHSFATRLEQEIDSMNLFVIKADIRLTNNELVSNQRQLYRNGNDEKNNDLNIKLDNANKTNIINGLGIFRHKFKKKGRSVALSAAYSNNATTGTDNIASINDFFKANTFSDQIRILYRNGNDTRSQQYKSSFLFTEALTKKFFLESFYNFAFTNNNVSRPVTNPADNEKRIDTLSIYYNNDIAYNRLGTTIRYAHEGVNISTGLAAQNLHLYGFYARSKTENALSQPIDRNFFNVIPYVDFSMEFENNTSTSFGYSYSVQEPQIEDLQPVPNVDNPAYRIVGNPNLTPERSHNLSASFNYWNSASNAHAGIDGEYTRYDNNIVYSQNIENIDKIGLRTVTKPINVNAGTQTGLNFWSGFPIVPSKLMMNINGSVEWNLEPAFVNDIANETNSRNLRLNGGLSFTPNPKLIIGLRGNISRNTIAYSISPDQNQLMLNQSATASIKWAFFKKTFLESNFAYSAYQNERFDFNQKIPIWNASVRQLFGKNNKVEARLAVFDIFNKRLSINQFASQNFVERSVAPTLARYLMLSISYNLRGYEAKIKKNNWW